MKYRTFHCLVVAAVLWAGGCTITQTGNPPLAPELDPTLVGPNLIQPEREEELLLRGEPMSVSPPEGEVVVLNLSDASFAPVREPVAADGSFSILALIRNSETMRMYVRTDDARSEPLDLLRISRAVVEAVPPPLADCLRTLSSVPFASGQVRSLLVTNGCPDPVELGGASLHYADRGYVIRDDGLRSTVPAGAEAIVEVELTPAAASLEDEVLFIDVLGPQAGRIAVTLYRGADSP